MKTFWQWVLTILLYGLLYMGATDGSVMIMHFHHNDHRMPIGIGVGVNGIVIPFGIGFLIAACLRRELLGSAWPLVFAPALLSATSRYAMNEFYPPYSKEALSLLGTGVMQGVSAFLGWFLYRRFSGMRTKRLSAEVESHDRLHL
jgi:hypothetical protein